LRTVHPREGNASPVGRERNVAVNTANHSDRRRAQHRRTILIKVRVPRVYRLDEIKIIAVRGKREALVGRWRRWNYLCGAVCWQVAQPQALQALGVDHR